MITTFIIFISLIVLSIASVTDLKTREVPDWLSYGLIFTGIGLRTLYAIMEMNWLHFYFGFIGFLVFFTIACLMYYTGQWGGGDAKILMGLGILIGIKPELESQMAFTFLYSLLFSGAIYGVGWVLYLFFTHYKACVRYINTHFYKDKNKGLIIFTLCILITVVALFTPVSRILSFIISFLLLFIYLFWILTRTIEQVAMTKVVPVSVLTEGDWIIDDVIVGNKNICGPKDLGITKNQILELKKHNISRVTIKEGIPFIPSFLIALLITLLAGDWLSKVLLFL